MIMELMLRLHADGCKTGRLLLTFQMKMVVNVPTCNVQIRSLNDNFALAVQPRWSVPHFSR